MNREKPHGEVPPLCAHLEQPEPPFLVDAENLVFLVVEGTKTLQISDEIGPQG